MWSLGFSLMVCLALVQAAPDDDVPPAGDRFVSYKPSEFSMIRVALGGYTTVIQSSDTEVHQWGIDHGEKIITFPERIEALSCGGYHCLALSETGTVYEWGQRDSSKPKEPRPLAVPYLIGFRVVKIAAGFRHNVAITEEGEVYIWGETLNGKVGHPHKTEFHIPPTQLKDIPPMIQASCGGDHTILMDRDHFLWSLGSNSDMQLGRNSYESSCHTPMSVAHHEKTSMFSAGGDHTLLLSESGKPYSFGWGNKGQLGHGTTVNIESPRLIKLPEGEVPLQVAAGAYGHSMILTANGNVYTFGINDFGQLGYESDGLPVPVPTRVQGLPKVKEVLGGGFKHSAVITDNGELILFGDNSFGQLCPQFLTTGQQWVERLAGLELI